MKLSAWLAERRGGGTGTSQAMDWLVVGMGNPGPKYADTRHNAGRMVVAELARRHSVELGSVKFNARFGSVRLGDMRVLLAMPLCYMNESGQVVAPLARFYQIPPERILAVYDDFDLPLGRLRLRSGGSGGGHNGVASLIRSLGTQAFPRLRLGIGWPPSGWDSADYVLGRFTKDERELIDSRLPDAADAIERTVREGVLAAMNGVNGREDAKAGAQRD